jgi:hypothetical protein
MLMYKLINECVCSVVYHEFAGTIDSALGCDFKVRQRHSRL